MTDISRLIELEIPHMRSFARSLVRNHQAVDDLVQNTLLRALEKQHLWQPGTRLRSWMFAIMHNLYVNDVRKSVVRGVEILPEKVALMTPATQVSTIEFRDLRRILATLPEEQRRVVMMIYVEELSYEEVSAILSIPLGTVRSRLHRARDTIRARMLGDSEKFGSVLRPVAHSPRARKARAKAQRGSQATVDVGFLPIATMQPPVALEMALAA
jgi:RNA polymerase sigma-70 factor (ECF subfamily)